MTIVELPRRRRRGLHWEVVDDLGQAIVSGQWSPEESLPPETDLAVRLDVSRTVVREAIKVLASKGLIESRPKTGTRVLERGHWDLADRDVLRWQLAAGTDARLGRELLEVRAILEPQAAALAATRRTDADADRLATLITDLEAAVGDPDAYIRIDMEFHGTILEAAHNVLLSQLTATIREAQIAVRDVTVRVPGGPAREMGAHRAVADAVIRRDSQGAATAMETLISDTWRDFETVLGDRLVDS